MKVESTLARALPGTGKMVDFSGTWTNQLASEMTLLQTDSELSGEYESAVSETGQKTMGDLRGYVDGDLIAFVVHWRDFQAITTWLGQLEPKAPRDTIKTLWHLTKQVSAGDEWQSINTGSDSFTRK